MSSIGMCRLRDCLVAAVFALTLPSITAVPAVSGAPGSVTC